MAHTLPAQLSAAEISSLRELQAALAARLGDDLVDVRLFGSRARGEGNEDSDVDVLVLVTDAGFNQRRFVHDLAYDIALESGVPLAPLVLRAAQLEELRRRERLLAAEIDRDGVPL